MKMDTGREVCPKKLDSTQGENPKPWTLPWGRQMC